MSTALFPSNISKTLFEQVKLFEGPGGQPMLKVYLDPAGIPTGGWGAIKGLTRKMVGQAITYATAEQWLTRDLAEAEAGVRKHVKVKLNQNQYDVLVDFVFNLGAGALGSSTLLKRLNAGDYAAVPDQIKRWNKAKVGGKLTILAGLVKRRDWEAAYWKTAAGTAPYTAPHNPGSTVIPAKPSGESKSLFDLIAALLSAIFQRK